MLATGVRYPDAGLGGKVGQIDAFPAELLAYTGPLREAWRPRQGDNFDVWTLRGEHGRFILKAARSPGLITELQSEFRVLSALSDYQPFVAPAIASTLGDGTGYFLFGFLDGDNLLDALDRADRAGRLRLMESIGFSLRRIHSWTPPLARPGDWLEQAIKCARDQVPADTVSALRRIPQDIVFAHGDFCLPNAIVRDGEVVGVIDWSRGGYADRRIDLAAAVWSIGYNLGDEAYSEEFLRAYRYSEPPESLRHHEALWKLMP